MHSDVFIHFVLVLFTEFGFTITIRTGSTCVPLIVGVETDFAYNVEVYTHKQINACSIMKWRVCRFY